MLKAVVTRSGGSLEVNLVAAEEGGVVLQEECAYPEKDAEGNILTQEKDGKVLQVCGEGPSPIAPEVKELAWGGGAFIVFAVLMRYVLYPRLKKGTDARYASIREGHESADAARAAARGEVAEYEAALASVKAEAASRIDAARLTLESERSAALAQVNARIAAKREAAAAEAQATREAVSSQIESAVADVVASAVEKAVGKRPDSAVVSRAVADSMSAGVR